MGEVFFYSFFRNGVRGAFLTGMVKTVFWYQWWRISILEYAIFSFRNGPEAFINRSPM
jgi:hypothetical protein